MILETDTGLQLEYYDPPGSTGAGWYKPWGIPWGMVAAPVSVVSNLNNSSSSTYVDVTGMSITWTVPAVGRQYKMCITANVYAETDANATIQIQIADSSDVEKKTVLMLMGLANNSVSGVVFAYESGLAAGSTTRKVRFRRGSGSGTHHFGVNSSSFPAIFTIEDVGPA